MNPIPVPSVALVVVVAVLLVLALCWPRIAQGFRWLTRDPKEDDR